MIKKVKHILSLIVATCFVGLASSCAPGNKSYGMGNYNFKKIHIFSNEGGTCCNVEKWYENESGVGIEVKTDKGALFLSEGTYMLIENYCPICKK